MKEIVLPLDSEVYPRFIYFLKAFYFKNKNYSTSTINILLDNSSAIIFKRNFKDTTNNNGFIIKESELIQFLDELADKGLIEKDIVDKLKK